MLKVKNISKTIDGVSILSNINFELHEGEVLSIIGPSGAGKSTLLRTLNLLGTSDTGEIQIGNDVYDLRNITKKDTLSIRKRTAMVFQNFSLFSRKTALENVEEGLKLVKKFPNRLATEIATEKLDLVGMSDRKNHYPSQLSGGQKQRVGIARALALNPEIILFDEPTSALDPEMVQGVLSIIRSIAHKDSIIILVTHEMNFARDISDKILFLENGQMIDFDTPDRVFNNTKIERITNFINLS